MFKINNYWFCLMLLSVIIAACEQSAPSDQIVNQELGDLEFSGYQWKYKQATTPVGPGPNRFLGTDENAWVDSLGYLHMKIIKKNNFWYSSEIISTAEFGYGTYIFTCVSDIRNFDPKVVFGFFTWNNYSFQSQGNSEVDIEFSRWNNPNDSLLTTFSVQPVSFGNTVPYYERTKKPVYATSYLGKQATYMFRWTPDSISWEAYEGELYPGPNKTASWSFNTSNPARTKIEGGSTSDPIVIPAPEDSTNMRINFWLLNGLAPDNGKEHEIIVKNFKYYPL